MKKRNQKKNKRAILHAIVRLAILLFLVGGTSYLVLMSPFLKTQVNATASGYLSFHYTENSNDMVVLEQALPLSNQKGKKSEVLSEFTVDTSTNHSFHYQILLVPLQVSLSSSQIKIYLTDGKNRPFSDFIIYPQLSSFSTKEDGSWIIYQGRLAKEEKQKFQLRMWISEEVELTETRDLSFQVIIKEI